jgi:predicted ATPase/DNA-binding CsgD family transcriptional regulator
MASSSGPSQIDANAPVDDTEGAAPDADEPGARPSSLPAELTPLVGRFRERTAVADLIRNPEVRLLVLTGPGGVGKTRLALTVAATVRESFRDGVCFVDLAPIAQADQVLPTIAAALAVRNSSSMPLIEAVQATLRSRTMLLVIDNVEHVTAAASLLTDLLIANPGLTILATSRAVLSIYGEHVYPVPPMGIPVIPEGVGSSRQLTRTIAASEAVQLFVRRATAANSAFRLGNDNAAHVLAICRLLDGLPLAIELAAARITTLTPRMLARRLKQRLPMLEDGPANVPDRLRTMRNAIAWSYDLLCPEEQTLFRRLSVFAGAWTLADARAIAGESLVAGPDEPDHTLHLIASLIDKSLIRRVDTTMDVTQFTMLQTLREFGLEHLAASGERDEIGRRHALRMLAVAERAEPELTGPRQVVWLDRLAASHPDFHLAFDWLMAHDAPANALRLATALWRFAYTRGHLREGREWIEAALERAPERSVLRARALNGAAILANMEGNLTLTRTLHAEALAIGEEHGDQRVVGVARMGLGDVAATERRFDEARREYEAVERIFREIDDQRSIAALLTNRGNLLWTMGLLDEARADHEQAQTIYGAIGDRRGVAWSVTNIGRIAAQRGEYDRALPHLRQALEAYRELGDRGGSAEALEGIAQVALGRSDPRRAATLLAAADGLREAVDHPVAPIDRDVHTRMLATIRDRTGADFEERWNADRALPFPEIMAVVRAVASAPDGAVAGDAPDGPHGASPALARREDPRSRIKELRITDRELEVLSLIAAGKTDKDIAEELFISVRTVQSHVANVLAKLDVKVRSAAVARAIRSGIIL